MQVFYSSAVEMALKAKKPVVALESTIIAHGMPYPQNLETARKLEAIIEEGGATPATIAILGGKIKIGLEEEDLLYLAQNPGVAKASRRDMPIILAKKQDAATTVAATMIGAAMAGIKVFATGGIGGVHRRAEKTFDISADLQELAKTNVAVVSAGAKAILDLGLTLEYLETMGVPVIGYQTDDFPAFYCSSSGSKVPYRAESGEEIAGILYHKWLAGLQGGVLVANPIEEQYALPSEMIEEAVQAAITEAEENGIGGKALTPFLLKRITAMTEGKSLFSNIRLVENNARLATKIAVALVEMENEN